MGVDPGPLPFPSNRLDPLNGFAVYPGRLNLASTHYYGSLAFEALFGFVIAAAFVIGTIVWLIVMAFKECCCKKPLDPQQAIDNEHVKLELRKRKLMPKIFLALFCAAAIAGGACIWVGGLRLRKTADTFLDKSVATIDNVIYQVTNVTAALQAASLTLQGVDTTQIASADTTVTNARKELDRIVKLVKDGTERFAIGTTCYGAGIIGLSLFALVFSLLHVKHLIGFCNFLVWWLHVIGWVLTGLCFIIYVFSSDMCAAKAYIDKNGGVRSIIPCVSPTDGMKALNVTYGTMYFAVEDANNALYRAFSSNGQNNAVANAQGYLCNPVARNTSALWQYSLASKCPYFAPLTGNSQPVNRTVAIGSFGPAYKSLRCDVNTDTCYTLGKIKADDYDTQAAKALAASVLVPVAPLAQYLLTCQFIVDAWNDLGTYLCSNVPSTMQMFFGGFFLYSVSFFPMFVILVIGYNRFRPACCDSGRGQVDSEAGEGGYVVGVVPQDDKGGQQLGQYAVNHNY